MTAGPRRAATLVETGAIVLVCLLVFAGIFEYGRFLVTLHARDNATRNAEHGTQNAELRHVVRSE